MVDQNKDNYADCSMMELFRIEAENHTRILEDHLVEVEHEQTREKIEPLMRAAHSLKGAARIVGLNLGVSLAHAMEDVLSAAMDGNLSLQQVHIDLLLKANDIFSSVCEQDPVEISAGFESREQEISDLESALRQALQKEQAPAFSNLPRAEAETPVSEPVDRGTAAPSKHGSKDDGFVRVQAASLTRLMGLAGEFLVHAKNNDTFSTSLQRIKNVLRETASDLDKVAQPDGEPLDNAPQLSPIAEHVDWLREQLADHIDRFESYSRRLEFLADRLYNEVILSKMRPFMDGTRGFPRLVRDLARELGKKVKLVIKGEDTRVDRDILEALEAPLNHVLRNAVDHGIEMPGKRRQAGKSEEGTITLEARHRAGMLHITIVDDGQGIDLNKLRESVVQQGRVTHDIADDLQAGELIDFLFLPGFSTADEVTEVSGRGIGLDVVYAMVRDVGGTVRVMTDAGKGTTIHLELPLTRSVVRALVVEIDEGRYAIPLARIDHVVRVTDRELNHVEDRPYLRMAEENIALIHASEALALPRTIAAKNTYPVIVVSDRLDRYGLVVDAIVGQRELVVQPLDPRFGDIPNIGAGAISEEGLPVLLIDVDDIVRSTNHLLESQKPGDIGREAQQVSSSAKKRILVVDDSLTVREVERKLLKNAGYRVATAVDGMDAWHMIETQPYDLVVSDVDMPRLNGIELVERIRASKHNKSLPVIIVSYKDREEDRMKGLAAGADYYLTKSTFHDESLIRAVSDLIGDP